MGHDFMPPQGDVFEQLRAQLGDTTPPMQFQLGGPMALAGRLATVARPAAQWITDRLAGASFTPGKMSKIQQIPINQIVTNAADHPDIVNPAKVAQISQMMATTPGRLPALELVPTEGGKFLLKDGRHRFAAAQGLGIANVPATVITPR